MPGLQFDPQALVFALVKGHVGVFESRVLAGLFAGDEVGARSWLHLSLEIAKRTGAEKEWKLRALDEKDLELLWVEIKIA